VALGVRILEVLLSCLQLVGTGILVEPAEILLLNSTHEGFVDHIVRCKLAIRPRFSTVMILLAGLALDFLPWTIFNRFVNLERSRNSRHQKQD
jgi:hypothetical protein